MLLYDNFYKKITCIFVLIFMSLHSWYVLKIGADVAYMDTLRYLTYYPYIKDNVLHMLSYWNQGDHRGVFTLFVLFSNITLFGMNTLLANLLTGLSLSLIAYVISIQWLRSVGGLGRAGHLECVLIVLFVCFTVFGLHSFELYTLDLGFPEITRNLAYVIIAAVVFEKSRTVTRLAQAIICITIVAVMITMSYGRIYAFSLSLVCASVYFIFESAGDKALTRRFQLLLFSAVIGLAAYGALSFLVPPSIDASALKLDLSPHALHGLLYSLSSSLMGAEAVERLNISTVVLNALGCYIIVITAYGFRTFTFVVKNKFTYLPVFLALYGLANALSVAISRGGDGYTSYMASRYYQDFCFVILGVVWIVSEILFSKDVNAKEKFYFKVLLAVFAVAWFYCYSATTVVEVKSVPYRAIAFDKMRSISLSCGTITAKQSELLQANNLDIANDAISVQRKYGLGLWSGNKYKCKE